MPDFYPDLVLVCDHGIAGGRLDHVGRFQWIDEQGVWLPDGDAAERVRADGAHELVYGGAITRVFLEGNRPGWHNDRRDDERPREHYELACPIPRCGNRVRIPDEDLQTVIAVITARSPSRWFQAFLALAPSVTDTAITVTLPALQRARDRVEKLGMLKQRT
ncbi:hypothetical protein [Mycobacterium malmoense]|uniref:hypothetical protein n=1 Tax=Mycobacterium malmoense TaxID=1780 RepID=UPI001132560C|nr:hypothetical protein [Mycobacterium malmoense]